MTAAEFAFAAGVFLVAGGAKGLLGIGLPTIAISLMSQVLDPRLAITLTLGPLLLTNIQQSWRSGHILRTLKRYAPYWVTLAVTIALSAVFAQGLSAQALLLIMGVGVITFTTAQLLIHPPPLPKRAQRPTQVAAGAVSGLMGGVTAIWGPPILMYLIAARVDNKPIPASPTTIEDTPTTLAPRKAHSIRSIAGRWQVVQTRRKRSCWMSTNWPKVMISAASVVFK